MEHPGSAHSLPASACLRLNPHPKLREDAEKPPKGEPLRALEQGSDSSQEDQRRFGRSSKQLGRDGSESKTGQLFRPAALFNLEEHGVLFSVQEFNIKL